MRDAVEAAADGAWEGFTKAVVNTAVEEAVSKVRDELELRRRMDTK